MFKKMARLGVLLAGVTGLLATATPPAQATTVGSVVFVIDATVDGGTHSTISYPCFTGLSGTPAQLTLNPNTALCLGLITSIQTATKTKKGTPKPPVPNTQVNLVNSHNTSTVTFGTVANLCLAVAVNVNKPPKPPIQAGNCVVAGGGTVSGHCGLSTGQVTGAIDPGAPKLTIPRIQRITFSVKFTGVGSVLILNGRVTKGTRNGWVKGVAEAFPPVDQSGGNLGQGSCTNLNPLTFRVVGAAAILIQT